MPEIRSSPAGRGADQAEIFAESGSSLGSRSPFWLGGGLEGFAFMRESRRPPDGGGTLGVFTRELRKPPGGGGTLGALTRG